METQPNLNELPFLRSLCWQGAVPTLDNLSALEVLQIYERNWHYRGVMADLNDTERLFIRSIAQQHHSWLVNDV